MTWWGVLLAAAGLQAFQLSRPGMLFGMTADVAVYLASAIRLAHGLLPYRDFVIVQPPGITLLTAPWGLLASATGSRDALAALRLTTPLIAAASALLAMRALRHRGLGAMAAGAALVCAFPAELYALGSVLLEPLVNLVWLGAVVAAFEEDELTKDRRRLLLAGMLLGAAGAIKLTGFAPLPVFVLLLATDARRLAPLLAGAVLGFGLPVLPFAAAAPGNFVHDVFFAQAERATSGWAWLALPVLAAAACWRLRLPGLTRLAIVTVAIVAAALLLPEQHYPQYPALLAPPLALAVGRVTPGRLLAPVAVAMLAAGAWSVHDVSAPDVAAQVDALVPRGACTLSDSPRLLVTTDRFDETLRPGCTVMTDPFGTSLAMRDDPAAAAALWLDTFEHADYVVTDRPVSSWYIDPRPDLLRYVAEHFRTTWSHQVLVYIRIPSPR